MASHQCADGGGPGVSQDDRIHGHIDHMEMFFSLCEFSACDASSYFHLPASDHTPVNIIMNSPYALLIMSADFIT